MLQCGVAIENVQIAMKVKDNLEKNGISSDEILLMEKMYT